ncbi:MAG: hypothetical protein RBU37_24690 [Myxococcota bacterium]|nr:hypothetical protein [Myxococcota bacterium]
MARGAEHWLSDAFEPCKPLGGTGQAPNQQELGGTGQVPNQQELGGTGQVPNQQELGGTGQAPNQQEVSEARHESASVAGASDAPEQRCEGLARASECNRAGWQLLEESDLRAQGHSHLPEDVWETLLSGEWGRRQKGARSQMPGLHPLRSAV